MTGYDDTVNNGKPPSSTVFFSQCVRINKPCHLVGMARSWPMHNWHSLRSDTPRLGMDTIGEDTTVTIYK